MARKKKDKPAVNPQLEGLDVNFSNMGEIRTSLDISTINAFLNENVEDKKLTKLKPGSSEEE
jgi:hypothetical protein